MSLNGLDDPKVKEAHTTAVAEPGGWFLLKYVSRDELELLGRGNGGIVEVRNAIAQYEENSPLYGFLRYRRRNVIIKYLPEECSRLVQARVTVHFNSLCDHFSPYDTAFSIANPKELKDTKLSAACSLHAASGSTSSSTSSLRRRRLMEIAEEEEEEERVRKRQSTVKEEERPTSSQGIENGTSASVSTLPPPPAVTLNSDLANSPEESRFTGALDPPIFTGAPRPSSPTKSFDDAARRNSSQSARPDLYSYSTYTHAKAKVKLGPRPSLETGGRPRTSAGTGTYRPVSSIPAGFKLSKGSKRSQSQDKISENGEPLAIKEEGNETPDRAESGASIIVPEEPHPEYEHGLIRPHTSSGGVPTAVSSAASLSLHMPVMPPPQIKQNYMTPEKARLMKAMKLREKRRLLSTTPTYPERSADEPSEPSAPSLSSDRPVDAEQAKNLATQDEGDAGDQLSVSHADSAIGMDVANDHASIDTRTDSHLDSPTGALSDIGDSTKASSLSESTDETLQPDHHPRKHSGIDDDADKENDNYERLDTEPVTQVAERGPNEEHVQSYSDVAKPRSVVESEGPAHAHEEEALDLAVDSAAEDAPIEQTDAIPISKFASTPPPKSRERQAASLECSAPSGDSAGTPNTAPAASGATPDSAQFKIPFSKFSGNDAIHLPTTPTASPIPFIVTSAPHPEDATGHDRGLGRESETGETGRTSVESRRLKRKAAVGPIRTDLDTQGKDIFQSESDLSDDDDLMEELQSATLEQAKPMTVSKSPITPAFPIMSPKRSTTALDGNGPPKLNVARAASNPIRGSLLSPTDVSTSSARTVSSGAAFLHKITQQTSSADLRPKSAKIGSSISQRIKALEKLSSTAGSSDAAPKERPSSTFFSVRKTSPAGEPARSPSVLARASAALRGTTPSPPGSRDHSPETGRTLRDRSGSMASRLSVFESGNAPRGRPESIQVKARIVRDPAHPFPKGPEPKADPSAYGPLDLKQSPLVVDHQRASPPRDPIPSISPEPAPALVEPDAETQPERRLSLLQRRWSKGRRSQSEDRNGEVAYDETKEEPSNRPRRRSSLTVVKDFIKDRRDSLLGGRSPSTDNLNLGLFPQNTGNLISPALATPSSRSPSRPPSVHQNSMFPRRLSINSRRSSIEAKSPALQAAAPLTGGLSPSLMTETSGESDGDDRLGSGSGDKISRPGSNGSGGTLSPGAKSASRATRFMRRLSNSLGSSRKNMAPSISPTVAEEDDVDVAGQNGQHVTSSRGSGNQQSFTTYLGDVNVQFPDTLLWKRRTMCLDSQGFVILSTVQGVTSTRDTKLQAGAIKRYHLSDFRTPYIPEMEVQELPNSVVLDFVDGSGLQIACEDRAGQLNTLHILQTAHRSHDSFGQ